MFQIRVAADILRSPVRELASQHQAEAVAKCCARCLTPKLRATGGRQIGDLHLTYGLWETLGLKRDAISALALERNDPADEVAVRVQARRTRRPFHSERSQF